MRILLPILLLVSFLTSCTHSKPQKPSYSSLVSFEAEGKKFQSEVRLPKKFKDRVPLVVIIHEWWGRTAYVQDRSRMLTEQGYATLAVDLYGDGKTVDNPKEAMEQATPVYNKPERGMSRPGTEREQARKDPHVDPEKIYVIGYCFGGSQALNLAKSGAAIKGAASFHGGLLGYKARDIRAKILVLNGGADPMVPAKDVEAFKKEMTDAKVDYRLVNYPGAKHAFTNPAATETGKKFNLPVEYNKAADEASWKELLSFLKQE